MGNQVFKVTANVSTIEIFAHCASPGTRADKGSVTLAFVNLDAENSVVIDSVVLNGTPVPNLVPRQEFILSAENEHGRDILLNGQKLSYTSV